MRVVFFVQGERVPAARARGFALASWLDRQGVACDVRVPYPSVYGDTRLNGWLGRPRPIYALVAAARRVGQLGDLRQGDVVFFQRPMVELPTVLLERIAAAGRRSIFDFDDAIYLNRFGRRKIQRLVALTDHIVVGNETLAEAAAAPDKTTIIPTAIDTDFFVPGSTRSPRGREVVIGWTGLSSNYPQLAIALCPLRNALRRSKARLLIISDAPPPPNFSDLAPEYRRWCPKREVEDLQAIDIGLMPLPDTASARGKCAFKLLQYMALGLPGLASPVGVNRTVVTDGKDGFLPATAEDWENTLIALIKDPDLRASIGHQARQRVLTAYSQHALFPRYLDIVRRLAGVAT